MTITAVYDANVLYPSLLRDLLIRVALRGAVHARWSEPILDEVFQNLLSNRPDLNPGSLARTRALMNDALRDVNVTGFEHLIDELHLPDPDDRHVLAAAIHANADVIVTFNLKDFPADLLEPHRIVAQHPDAFLADLFEENPAIVADAVRAIASASRNPARTLAEIVSRLDGAGLTLLAIGLRTHLRQP